MSPDEARDSKSGRAPVKGLVAHDARVLFGWPVGLVQFVFRLFCRGRPRQQIATGSRLPFWVLLLVVLLVVLLVLVLLVLLLVVGDESRVDGSRDGHVRGLGERRRVCRVEVSSVGAQGQERW